MKVTLNTINLNQIYKTRHLTNYYTDIIYVVGKDDGVYDIVFDKDQSPMILPMRTWHSQNSVYRNKVLLTTFTHTCIEVLFLNEPCCNYYFDLIR